MAENFLSTLKVSDISSDPKEIFFISSNQSSKDALELLIDKGIYAVPITEGEKTLGLVNLSSLIKALVLSFEEQAGINKEESPANKVAKLAKHQFSAEDLKAIESKFASISAKNLISNSYTPRSADTPLKEIILDLAKNDRAPIVDKDGKVVSILSQAVVVKYLIKNMDKLGSVVSEKLENLNIVSSPVQTVSVGTPAIVAFTKMIEEGFSSMGILDEEHQIVGIISFKDIKGAVANLRALFFPVDDYVNRIRREDYRDVVPTVNCKSTDTLAKAISKLDAVGVHRLFVSTEKDKGHHFSGILTLADVLTVFVR